MNKTVPQSILFTKASIMLLLFFLCIGSAFGQVKIGDNPQNIDPTSLLELESSDKAMVLSRITTAQMQAITPLQGALIYNIEEQCIFYYSGSNWINLCRDANGFSIIDNGDNTYTVNDGTNPEFTFSTNTETITNIVQNSNGTFTYTNEAGEETIIANGSGTGTGSLSITNNGDNTYTVNDGTNPEFIITATPETVTNIVQNPNGTYTYTNEAGDETIIATTATGTSTFSITDNGNNTYTFNDGTIPAFTLSADPETITNIVQNPDGTFTYTNEAGDETIITNGSGSLSITNNGDNTYTVNDGTNPAFTITATPETVTSIVQNENETYTYTNEAGDETIIASSELSITDNGDNTYTVNDGTNPEFTITATPETVTSIVQNEDGTYTYTNEARDETIIASSELSITDNGDNTYTVNDGTNPAFTITATPETVTSIVQNEDGTYTYTNEAGDETIIASSELSITDNGDNTYTVNDGTNPEFTITATPETVTSIAQNEDGTYTYTNEAGDETIIASSELAITDNGDNTYTVNDGTNPEFTITATPETVTSIAQNENGTYTYTNEAGDETIIASSELSITDNGDNTYTVNDGTNPEFTISAAPETISTLTENTSNGTYTYTNEDGDETIISFSGTSEEGSVFFADDANGLAENNTQLFWDNTNERLGIGTNTTLTDKLTVNGNLGISDGSESEPSYRFSADPDTGIYRSNDDELGFAVGGTTKMKLTPKSLFLNNALPIDPVITAQPVLIRANQGELLAFQQTEGSLKWFLNMKEPIAEGIQGGIGFVEAGVGRPTLFIENAKNIAGSLSGSVGINTQNPQAALHVIGGMRVTILPPAQPNESFVTVDENGDFHKSASSQPVVTGGGRWTNSAEPLFLDSNGLALLAIFDEIDYNDGSIEFYESNSNVLTIKSDGRYEIGATISLKGNLLTNRSPANTWARISINGIDTGAFHVAANSGSTDANAFSSINISDVLNLNAGDTIRIKLFSNADPSLLFFAGRATSSFTIMKQ